MATGAGRLGRLGNRTEDIVKALERAVRRRIDLVATAPNPSAVPIKAMRFNARMALIFGQKFSNQQTP